jgi:hypothetical protein
MLACCYATRHRHVPLGLQQKAGTNFAQELRTHNCVIADGKTSVRTAPLMSTFWLPNENDVRNCFLDYSTKTLSRQSWDSSVGIVSTLRAGQPGFDFRQGRIFSSPQRPDWLWGPTSLLGGKAAGA